MDLFKKRKRCADGTYRESANWWLRFQYQGIAYKRSTGERNRKAAERAGRSIRAAIESDVAAMAVALPVGGEVAVATLAVLAAHDIDAAASRGVSAAQAASIEGSWVPLLRFFGCDSRPDQVTYDRFNEYIRVRRDAGLRGQSIRKERQAMSRGLRIAKRRGDLQEVPELPEINNDSRKVEQAGTFREPELVFRFLEELDALPRAYPARHQAEIVLRTGLRHQEVRRLSLSWVEVLPEGATLPAVLHVPDWAAKARVARTVGLSAEALAIIADLAQGRPEDEPLCPSKHAKAMRRASQAVGSDSITLRDLRHTYATLAGANGDVRAVQEALGHTSLTMTQRYLHSTQARTVAASAAVARSLADAAGRPPHAVPPTSGEPMPEASNPPEAGSGGVKLDGRGDRIRTYDPLLPKHVEIIAADIMAVPNGEARLLELWEELCGVTPGRPPRSSPPAQADQAELAGGGRQ